jgi:hypothetical protein
MGCTALTTSQIDLLHRVLRLHMTAADLAVRDAPCPGGPAGPSTNIVIGPSRRCSAYEVRLRRSHRVVEVRITVPGVMAIGLRAGAAVATRLSVDPTGAQSVRFEDLDIDEVVLYVASPAKSLEICLDQPDQRDDAEAWAHEPFVARGLQVPIRSLDPSLTTEAAELAEARSRLLPGEDIPTDAFVAVAEMMNAAAAGDDHTAPVWYGMVTRDQPDDPFIELRTWSYALSLLVDPAWRRSLGYAVLDPRSALDEGRRYDYRITGRFRRRDLEERVHGFHAVPRGTTLPASFSLGPLSLMTPGPPVVAQRPEPSGGVLDLTGRKGVALDGDPCLTLSFPSPVSHLVLELEPGSDLRWGASTSELLTGLPVQQFGAPLPPDRRVVIAPADPVDTIVLAGRGFLYAVREADPLADPDEVVEVSTVLHGVRFQDSPRPEPPLSVSTTNLQHPTAPVTGADTEPPRPLGFRVGWVPAPPLGSPPLPWPADLAAAPPVEAMAFRVERRRVDVVESFEPVEELVFGARGARVDPPGLHPGVDLEAVYAEGGPPAAPVAEEMTFDDVLVDPHHAGPPPGSIHQYRVLAVDAIGRTSVTDAIGPEVRLEKHRAPPQPVGPPTGPTPATVRPAGVTARVLQAADTDLALGDRTLLGQSESAVVLEWGWGQRERDADPHATEFRVYWQPVPSDEVAGEVTGGATLVAGRFEMPATLDRPVEVDAMAGRYLRLSAHPFRVDGHDAGQTVTLRLDPSALDPSQVPEPASFVFRPALDGSEQRPTAWAERVAVVPLTPADTYRHVLRDVLVLDADHPSTRVWAGVSTADSQAYVPDALPAAAPNGGRPGNESAVVVVPATARYLGRPDLTVPPPLPDVPEQVTAEPVGSTVGFVVDLPALLPALPVPAGHLVRLERLRLDRVVAAMSARADDTVGAALPDGTDAAYSLANPGDQASLLAEIRSGTPARVEGRFLMDFVLRFGPDLEPWWEEVPPGPAPMGPLSDTLPAKADRHLHRVRLVDPAGHVSSGAAIPAQIVRVPSSREPRAPELRAVGDDAGSVRLDVRVRDAFDVAHVVAFAAVEDAGPPPGSAQRDGARLLRLPDRRDLYPDDGLRLRLADGTLLAPTVVLAAVDGTVEPPDRVLTAALHPGADRRVSLWAVTLTRDGIPSRVAGPVAALTGPPPLVAPAVSVSRAGGVDTVQWAPVTTLLAVERSDDGGVTWARVTPWLSAGTGERSLAAVPGTPRYRSVVRGTGGRLALGVEAAP